MKASQSMVSEMAKKPHGIQKSQIKPHGKPEKSGSTAYTWSASQISQEQNNRQRGNQ
jgi:hypothetical protein